VANDARVVIDNFQTGGLMTSGTGASTSISATAFFALMDVKTLARATGGQSSTTEYTSKGLDRMDQATRASYLLGYYPSRPLGDGAYRKLEIKVNRPGVTVFYRHGYFGRQAQPAFDRRTFLTSNRMLAAALYKREIRDILVKVNVTRIPGKGGTADEMVVDASIDPERIAFKTVEGKQAGSLEVAVFFASQKKMVLHERSQTIDLKLSPESFQRVQREGIPYTLRMPVKDSVRFVKVVVYNYEKDTVGSAEVSVK
jgi:hypothetical protein